MSLPLKDATKVKITAVSLLASVRLSRLLLVDGGFGGVSWVLVRLGKEE